MKKSVYIVLVVMIAMLFVGCGKKDVKPSPTVPPAVTQAPKETSDVTVPPDDVETDDEILPTGTPKIEDGIVKDEDQADKDEVDTTEKP